MRKNEKGFSVVEVLIIIVILGLIGAVGWLVYDRQKISTESNKTVDSSVKDSGDSGEQSKPEYTPPAGWKQYSDTNGISFYYPSSFDDIDSEYPSWVTKSAFHITKTPISESFPAPFGGGGSGLKYYFKTSENKWYEHYVDENMQKGAETSGFTTTKSEFTSRPVLYGKTGEGGGESYFILIANDAHAYQVVLPAVLGEFESEYEKTLEELKVATPKIIESIRFSN